MKYNIIKLEKKDFPEKLKNIKNAPPILYLIGNKNLLWEDCFGIVGTRKITDYGIKNCENFAKEFAFRKIPVVSGMAIGTDSVAHKTSLEYGGKTIAVLGSGFGNVFPKENLDLFENIIKSDGLVVTEFDYHVKPVKENFPQRNRIITALSEGILVIEAAYRSGSSITAHNAIQQGKLVFALPGKLDSSVGIGVNNLIKKGAIFTSNIDDILNNYPQFKKRLRITTSRKKLGSKKMKEKYKKIYEIIVETDGTIENIIDKTKLEIRDVLKILTEMEIEEIITQDISGKYVSLLNGDE